MALRKKYSILMLALLFACIEPYELKIPETNRVLVIDASLTNEIKAHFVNLSYSYNLDESGGEPVSGATVWLEDQQATKISFNEESEGHYVTSSTFSATPGNSYTLHIETPDGKTYYSSEESLIPSPPIDSIYGAFTILPSTEEGLSVRGVQFFIDSHDDGRTISYYRYKWAETYIVKVPYASQLEWSESLQDIITRSPSLEVCYKTEYSMETILGSSAGLTENRMSEFPVRFVAEGTKQLGYRYSLEVIQYAIGENLYRFYKDVKENNEGSGSFFDKQKGFVQGNIYPSDPNEPVVGVFEVAGVSIKRAFFDPEQFEGAKPYLTDFCLYPEGDTIPFNEVPDVIDLMDGKLIYAQEFASKDLIFLPAGCSDCRKYGSIEKPSFWED